VSGAEPLPPAAALPEASAPGGDEAGEPHVEHGDPAEETPPPSSVLQIVPGPYKAPISIRAAARFAQGGSLASYGPPPSMEGLVAPRSNRLVVVALVFVALLAAGAVGTALAFRFGGGRHHHPAPSEAPPKAEAAGEAPSDGTTGAQP
jgi:hypothetical protein